MFVRPPTLELFDYSGEYDLIAQTSKLIEPSKPTIMPQGSQQSNIETSVFERRQDFKLPEPPFLASGHGIVLLVRHYDNIFFEGIVLHSEDPNTAVGEYGESWNRESFEPFHGTVTLEQR